MRAAEGFLHQFNIPVGLQIVHFHPVFSPFQFGTVYITLKQSEVKRSYWLFENISVMPLVKATPPGNSVCSILT
jgi:hypothetical protein